MTSSKLTAPTLSSTPASASRTPEGPIYLGMRWRLLSSDTALVVTALAVIVPLFLLSEKLDIRGGLGWDGGIYGSIAADFPTQLVTNQLNDYYIQRILPSAIVSFGLQLTGIPRSVDHIIQAFIVLNAALLALVAYFWGGIARELFISVPGRWVGLLALFGSYAVLKFSAFYPVLTDVPGFAMGFALLYFYQRGSAVGLIVTILAGVFTWPTVIYVGAPLLVFGGSRLSIARPDAKPHAVSFMISLGIAVALLASYSYFADWPTLRAALQPVLNLSISVAVIALFFGFVYLTNVQLRITLQDAITTLRRRNGLVRLAALAVIVFILTVAQRLWSGGPPTLDTATFATRMLTQSIMYPAVSYVADAVYFGPIVLLTILLWPRVCQSLHTYGVGMLLSVGIGLLLALSSESRIQNELVGLIIPFSVKAIDTLDWGSPQYWLFGSVSLLASKVWLTIGSVANGNQDLYFMSLGPWMTAQTYETQGALALVCTYVLYQACVRGRSTVSAAESEVPEIAFTEMQSRTAASR